MVKRVILLFHFPLQNSFVSALVIFFFSLTSIVNKTFQLIIQVYLSFRKMRRTFFATKILALLHLNYYSAKLNLIQVFDWFRIFCTRHYLWESVALRASHEQAYNKSEPVFCLFQHTLKNSQNVLFCNISLSLLFICHGKGISSTYFKLMPLLNNSTYNFCCSKPCDGQLPTSRIFCFK